MKSYLWMIGWGMALGLATAAPRVLHVELDGAAVAPFGTTENAARTVQAALDAAEDGDVVRVGAGRFVGRVDFGDRKVAVVGRGPETVLDGDRAGTVVRFAGGGERGATLEAVTIAGGFAEDGGGILIDGAAPVVRRCVIFANQASGRGSGIFVTGRNAAPSIRNNVVAYNADSSPAAFDAHQIYIDDDAQALIANNTIVRGNGNGILIQSSRRPTAVFGNILAWNGSRLRDGEVIGRGICDFSGSARITANVFFQNMRAAILTEDFVDYDRIADAENAVKSVRLRANRDAEPGFVRFPGRTTPARFDGSGLRLRGASEARDAGPPGRGLRDRDGSRNDAGHTGGPGGWR